MDSKRPENDQLPPSPATGRQILISFSSPKAKSQENDIVLTKPSPGLNHVLLRLLIFNLPPTPRKEFSVDDRNEALHAPRGGWVGQGGLQIGIFRS